MRGYHFTSDFTVPAPAEPLPEGDGTAAERDAPEDPLADASVTVRSGDRYFHCLTVIGQIEGHTALPETVKATKYEHMIPRIVAVEQSAQIDGLLLILNTVGGDVEAGLALAELIAGMRKPTVSLVLGGGHSIGIPLAVAARYSLIAPSATMTVHPVRVNGLVLGVPQTMDYLNAVQERIVDFITAHSRIGAPRLRELMLAGGNLFPDAGTVLGCADAVREGLADAAGTVADAMDKLEEMADGAR